MSPDVAPRGWITLAIGSRKWLPPLHHGTMSARRGWHQDAIYFDHDAPCRDRERHRHCKGRWRGSVSLGYGPDGKRIRPRVSGQTKTIVQDRLKKLHEDLDAGLQTSQGYTIRRAA